MTKFTIRLSSNVRIAIAVAIAMANVALFTASSPAAMPVCGEKCVSKSGGALGFYVVCEGTGTIAACREGLTECYGYPCPNEPAASMAFEPVATTGN